MKKEKTLNSSKIVLLTFFLILILIVINSLLRNKVEFIMNNIPNYDKKTSFSILSANVGNLSIGCRNVLNKLCYKDVEERIAKNIQHLSPDIIVLQEVLAPWQCTGINEKNKKNKVCSEEQIIPQVRRLVGEGYTIACNSRNQFECIAVKTSFGEILGCPEGEICNNARTTPEIEGCDNGFNISAVTIKSNVNSIMFDMLNFHPQSTNAICRAKMISMALYGNETTKSLIESENVILLGDFNFDPWRDKDESVVLWNKFMKEGINNSQLEYHSGVTETNPPYFTSFLFYKPRTLDFVVSNFANGACHVLGESPNTIRLDGGKGMDHRALFGVLTLR